MWLDEIEDGAMEQVKHLARLPFAFHHVAIMPDSHQGFGMPIGGVLATQGVIIPNAVGSDIGCGMSAAKTSLTELDIDTLKKIMGKIRKTIPVGFGHNKIEVGSEEYKKIINQLVGINNFDLPTDSIGHTIGVVNREICNAVQQIGTLGGGNHFIEIQSGSDGHIWIMLHSGSRNIGLKVAGYYNKLAVELNEKWFSGVDPKWELAFLPIDSEAGQDYIKEMNYCVEFASANRELMMNRIMDIFEKETQCTWPGFAERSVINIAHNYARMENHFGHNVMVHRKGATLASEDTIGIIPGSQGTKSYIVKGKGNAESFNSCSHGAGRTMGRKDAERNLNLEEEIKKLDDQGILHGIRGRQDLDEASGAYKDIGTVMKNQSDLVEILVELQPLGVVKG